MARRVRIDRMVFRAPRHPSGRPVRQDRCVSRPIWRIPDDGFNTPRLRRDHNVEAIGFLHQFDCDDYDAEGRKR